MRVFSAKVGIVLAFFIYNSQKRLNIYSFWYYLAINHTKIESKWTHHVII